MTETIYGLWSDEFGWFTINGMVFNTPYRGVARAQRSILLDEQEWVVKVMAQVTRKPGPSEVKNERDGT